MINMNFSADKVQIVCSPDTVFTEYSFAIEQGVNWFFGRCVSSLKVERRKDNKDQVVELQPLVPVQAMIYSQVTSVGVLAKDGHWPKEIPFDKIWKIPGYRQEVRDGHHRVYRADKEQTVIQSYGLDPAVSIGYLAYGISDLVTGFFWLGATCVKWQGSMGMIQTMINKGFEEDDLKSYLLSPGDGYSLNQKVSTLP